LKPCGAGRARCSSRRLLPTAPSPEAVGKASREGDPAANAIIKASGAYIGQTLAALVNFFNPERIVLGGGVCNIGYLLLASVRHAVYQRSLALSTRHLVIEYAELGDAAGVAGAVALAWQEVLHLGVGTPLAPVTPTPKGAIYG